MDTLSPNNGSKSSSSGSSMTNSSMDLGEKPTKASKQRQRGQKLSRSRSLLQLLSRHLGRHFQHHHHQNDTVYSSQDDIRSSSTDSFSLSYERASRLENVLHGGSSLDLENTSSASYSPGLEFYDNSAHIYVETVYHRPGSAMEQLHPHYDDDSSSSSVAEEEEEEEEEEHDNENLKPHNETPQRSASATETGTRTSAKSGLHPSRISISSSVSRILHHFSASTASLRSLSCSSTPLRQLKTPMTKKSLTAHNSNNRSQNSNSNSNSSSSSCSNSNSSSNNSSSNSSSSNNSSSSKNSRSGSSSKSAKKDKKQQSILRPPVQYVYMKGMSGLYSRVPSYAVCCPYTVHHMY
ncbi:hypothetical protein ACLKA6_005013 [Drosophila palustris]